MKAYVKNQDLKFEVPYRDGGNSKKYLPDFVVDVDGLAIASHQGSDIYI